MNRHHTVRLLLALMAILLAGCSTATPQSSAPPTVDVSGTWTGAVRDGTRFYDESLRLQQKGSMVTGSGTVRLPQGAPEFTVDGTVSGKEFTYRTRPGGTGAASLTVNGDEMSGTNSQGFPMTLRRQR
jgi:hypothetical protein